MTDSGWSKHIAQVEKAEYAKACEEQKHQAGLIIIEVLNCIDCEIKDCGI